MKPLALTPEIMALAKRVIWFESPEKALAEPVRFLAYAFKYADFGDIAVLRQHFNDEALIHALINAPPGIIDARSWAYWNLVLRDLSPPPPMPVRTFDNFES
jgi:hypothetical protein